MANKCSTSGGKGNLGRFIDREPRICAAGVASARGEGAAADCLTHYLLQDHAAALLGDALLPPPAPRPPPPLRHPPSPDMRNAAKGEVASLINPPMKTKFQMLAEDFKDTVYASYWKKPLGQVRDQTPMLPEGFDIYGTTFGTKIPYEGSLYDLIMPKHPLPDKTPRSKEPGVQTDRHYCKPPFNPDLTYGYRCNVDRRGRLGKCCVTDDRVIMGTANKMVITSREADFLASHKPRVGAHLAPNHNIEEVPEGYTFGILYPPDSFAECMKYCEISPGYLFFLKCLTHLNSLRKCISKIFLPTFFRKLELELKYFDKEKCGWLPKEVVYKHCGSKNMRFNPELLEPLVEMWGGFDGTNIKYNTFTYILNYKQPLPTMPKIEDIEPECAIFKTTYREMVKPGQEADKRLRAGLPSGRYFDMDYPVVPPGACQADVANLPGETDIKSCVNPSVLTLLNVTHRDMFAARSPTVVRKVFEAVGEQFTDGTFDATWKQAQKQHSEGLVCFETFRRALYNNDKTN